MSRTIQPYGPMFEGAIITHDDELDPFLRRVCDRVGLVFNPRTTNAFALEALVTKLVDIVAGLEERVERLGG